MTALTPVAAERPAVLLVDGATVTADADALAELASRAAASTALEAGAGALPAQLP